MKYLGKRSHRERLPRQVGMDPEMGLIIRARAERRRRPVPMQILHLLEVGIEHDPETPANEKAAAMLERASVQSGSLHTAAHSSTSPQVSAPRRAVQHGAARENEELAS